MMRKETIFLLVSTLTIVVISSRYLLVHVEDTNDKTITEWDGTLRSSWSKPKYLCPKKERDACYQHADCWWNVVNETCDVCQDESSCSGSDLSSCQTNTYLQKRCPVSCRVMCAVSGDTCIAKGELCTIGKAWDCCDTVEKSGDDTLYNSQSFCVGIVGVPDVCR